MFEVSAQPLPGSVGALLMPCVGLGPLRTGVKGGCGPLVWCWELTRGPLEEQCKLLATEPSPESQQTSFKNDMSVVSPDVAQMETSMKHRTCSVSSTYFGCAMAHLETFCSQQWIWSLSLGMSKPVAVIMTLGG